MKAIAMIQNEVKVIAAKLSELQEEISILNERKWNE